MNIGDPTEALMERVAKLVPAKDAGPEWGNPLLSTTPTPIAIRELALTGPRRSRLPFVSSHSKFRGFRIPPDVWISGPRRAAPSLDS